MTEFASYVATLFSAALQSEAKNPLRAMREQIYSANSSVNNILKMYFPEQYGERQFLNYPLGHFFVAIANMWDSQRNRIFIKDLNDIRECFGAGILPEDTPGDLATIFGKMSALFEGCADINEMLSRLKKIQRSRKSLTDPVYAEHIGHISYYDIEAAEVDQLQRALTDLNELALYFYEDFEKAAHNFRDFYRKLRAYIQEQSENTQRLGEEYADILRRVLERLEEAESIDASASFECLKATMSIYLQQEPKEGKGANWIVRSFEQIDGDILRSSIQPDAATYHFACLTDEDMHGIKHSEFTWPLDADFFEVAQEPVDWKYQVFVKSRKEYKNFNRYALLYGLEFNRSNFKLSYVKRDGEKDQTLYSLFKILGLKTVPYKSVRNREELPDCTHIRVNGRATGSFSEFDYYRYKICRFRFVNESILEGNTIYKDPFLLGKYLEAWLENRVKTEMEGKPISEYILIKKLNDMYDEISRYFPFVQHVNRMDIINTIRNRIISGKSRTFPKLTPDQRRYMKIRELFIHQSLSDPHTHRKNVLADKLSPVSIDTVLEILSDEKLVDAMYPPEPDIWCQYCSIRETCAAFYSLETFKET